MGDSPKSVDNEKLISYCDDLLGMLKDKRDTEVMTRCVDDVKALRCSSDTDLANAKGSLQDYESKIDACRKKTEEAKSGVVADEELDLLVKELEEEHKKENLLLEELRVVTNEINDMERKRVSVEERKKTLKKLEQEELSAQRRLSMLASVTNIIPDLSEPSMVSGHIINREQKVVNKFEFHSTQMTAFDTYESIWKMIGL